MNDPDSPPEGIEHLLNEGVQSTEDFAEVDSAKDRQIKRLKKQRNRLGCLSGTMFIGYIVLAIFGWVAFKKWQVTQDVRSILSSGAESAKNISRFISGFNKHHVAHWHMSTVVKTARLDGRLDLITVPIDAVFEQEEVIDSLDTDSKNWLLRKLEESATTKTTISANTTVDFSIDFTGIEYEAFPAGEDRVGVRVRMESPTIAEGDINVDPNFTVTHEGGTIGSVFLNKGQLTRNVTSQMYDALARRALTAENLEKAKMTAEALIGDGIRKLAESQGIPPENIMVDVQFRETKL